MSQREVQITKWIERTEK